MTTREPVRPTEDDLQASSDVQPYEARGTVPVLSPEGAKATADLMTAVNGFYYPGDRSDAVLSAVAWLQEHPKARAALFPARNRRHPQAAPGTVRLTDIEVSRLDLILAPTGAEKRLLQVVQVVEDIVTNRIAEAAERDD